MSRISNLLRDITLVFMNQFSKSLGLNHGCNISTFFVSQHYLCSHFYCFYTIRHFYLEKKYTQQVLKVHHKFMRCVAVCNLHISLKCLHWNRLYSSRLYCVLQGVAFAVLNLAVLLVFYSMYTDQQSISFRYLSWYKLNSPILNKLNSPISGTTTSVRRIQVEQQGCPFSVVIK